MFLVDLILIIGISIAFTVGLYIRYTPRINNIEKGFNEFNDKVKDYLSDMTSEERADFFSSLSSDSQSFFNDILNNQSSINNIAQFQAMQHHMNNAQDFQNTQVNDFNQWAMNESMKAVTPFDHGGYVQGAGFNPSDTMAQQMHDTANDVNQNMHHDMNNNMHNDHSMNDHNTFGGM